MWFLDGNFLTIRYNYTTDGINRRLEYRFKFGSKGFKFMRGRTNEYYFLYEDFYGVDFERVGNEIEAKIDVQNPRCQYAPAEITADMKIMSINSEDFGYLEEFFHNMAHYCRQQRMAKFGMDEPCPFLKN